MQNSPSATIAVVEEGSRIRLLCSGSWTLTRLGGAARILESFHPSAAVEWNMEGVTEIDSAGIALWQLYDRAFEKEGFASEVTGIRDDQSKLYALLYHRATPEALPPEKPSWLFSLGRSSHHALSGVIAFLSFLGEAFVFLFHTLRHPSRIRYRSISAHIHETGATALPIIAVSAFLIGVVVAYQSVVQLQKFGADIFIVDMIGISLTRELAPLITAIIVAGRSGSAFTAQIGTMKMAQEIDAMKTMGFDPFTFLVWPRVIALMIVMPLLIFFADLIGILGGMVIAYTQSHLSFSEFAHRLQGALAIKHFVIGIAKGPFFAFLIAMSSLYRGFQVSLNTESIGRNTTQSVVHSIFLVIACDALFSVLLTELRI